MGKIILIVIGVLAALYTVAAIAQVVYRFLTADLTNAIGITDVAASIAVVFIGLIVSFICFRYGLAKPKADDKSKHESTGD